MNYRIIEIKENLTGGESSARVTRCENDDWEDEELAVVFWHPDIEAVKRMANDFIQREVELGESNIASEQAKKGG